MTTVVSGFCFCPKNTQRFRQLGVQARDSYIDEEEVGRFEHRRTKSLHGACLVLRMQSRRDLMCREHGVTSMILATRGILLPEVSGTDLSRGGSLAKRVAQYVKEPYCQGRSTRGQDGACMVGTTSDSRSGERLCTK